MIPIHMAESTLTHKQHILYIRWREKQNIASGMESDTINGATRTKQIFNGVIVKCN